MFLPSIAFAAFIAVAANARGDGSATLQPDDKGIEDKQHGKYVALLWLVLYYITQTTDTLYHSNNIPRPALHHTSSNRSSKPFLKEEQEGPWTWT